jgi:hypothetical protein
LFDSTASGIITGLTRGSAGLEARSHIFSLGVEPRPVLQLPDRRRCNHHRHHAPRAACLRVGYIQRKPDPNLKLAIAHELYTALERLDAAPELLGVLSSWGDGSSDQDVLDDLVRFNATGSSLEIIDRTAPESRELRCSFCHRRQSETEKLVTGPRFVHLRPMRLHVLEGHRGSMTAASVYAVDVYEGNGRRLTANMLRKKTGR